MPENERFSLKWGIGEGRLHKGEAHTNREDYNRDREDYNRDWEENFYILRHSLCPAVLSENFFMDSHSDLEYLQSRAGKQAVVDIHVEGIVEYLED